MNQAIPSTPAEYDHTRIIERPDGCYWIDAETGEEYGPFASLMAAVEDMEYNAESDYEPGETVEEAEDELGISDWIDPDTGDPGTGFTRQLTKPVKRLSLCVARDDLSCPRLAFKHIITIRISATQRGEQAGQRIQHHHQHPPPLKLPDMRTLVGAGRTQAPPGTRPPPHAPA